MDNWLKGLVAAACVTVIAVGGFYFWQQHQQAVVAEELGKQETMRRGCLAAVDENLPALKQYCAEKGYITQEQAQR
ncbi:hypothetical protein [Mesorhizobium sp. Pch-S]|uniref:hypothetical protein n=1 Tax=Mesorhizobium sp. Pch-S TaxID=2082387 RepID=UPI0010116C88|nr:hypothetical protein [Mesorhizobium sp. Pch-S]QAZ46144.1 hypothetical protein C1M53_27670 [Mesorhizobium sp. Pch-S]